MVLMVHMEDFAMTKSHTVPCADCGQPTQVTIDGEGLFRSTHKCATTEYLAFEDGSFDLFEDARNDVENGLYEDRNYVILNVPDHIGDDEEVIAAWILQRC